MFRSFIFGVFFTFAGCASEPDYITFDDLGERPQLGKADDSISGVCAGMTASFPSPEGLSGSYVASPQLGDGLRSITFASIGTPADGVYSAFARRGGVFGYESGAYHAMPDNPAIGAALALAPGETAPAIMGFTEGFWILGSRIDHGRVQQLCLWKAADLHSTGPWQPFALHRIGL